MARKRTLVGGLDRVNGLHARHKLALRLLEVSECLRQVLELLRKGGNVSFSKQVRRRGRTLLFELAPDVGDLLCGEGVEGDLLLRLAHRGERDEGVR